LYGVVLLEIAEHTEILVVPVLLIPELLGGNPGEMHDSDRRHNMARDALVVDATVEIDVVEQKRKPFVEQTANTLESLPAEQAEGGACLLDFLHLDESAITVEVGALKSPTERETIDGTAGSMVVS
jgi:hypothetical protein